MLISIIGAVLIGLTLGMLGSGGSAITVPVLVYVVGHGPKEAIAESMAIVGLISIAAAVPYAKAGQIDWRSVRYFGVPGVLGTLGGAWLGGVAPGSVQLIVFGGILMLSAGAMLRKPRRGQGDDVSANRSSSVLMAAEGTVAGIVTGFAGVGGGFLIVPALVILGHLPMRLAIGTSLVIIALNATVGFAKYGHYLHVHHLSVDVQTILLFTSIGVVGSLLGRRLNAKLNQNVLRRVFAGFLIVLGTFLIVREGRELWRPSSDLAKQPATLYHVRSEITVATSYETSRIRCPTGDFCGSAMPRPSY